MDRFSNVERMGDHYADDDFNILKPSCCENRTTVEKVLIFAVVVLVILAAGLGIGLVITARNNHNNNSTKESSSASDVCLTEECVSAAARIMQSMDRSVNPCDDFYTYACGTWKKTHVIPDDSSEITIFSILRDNIHMMNKHLYEDPDNCGEGEHAWRKAKDLYASCIDTDLIEQKNLSVITSILEELGGWPMIGANPGGNWDSAKFDLVTLLIRLRQYGIQPLINLDVRQDYEHSTQNIIYIFKTEHGTPVDEDAFIAYGRSTAELFGADPVQAEQEWRDVLAFQKALTEAATPSELDLELEETFSKTSLSEISLKLTEPDEYSPVQFSWYNYISGCMSMDGVGVNVSKDEPVVVTSSYYFKDLFAAKDFLSEGVLQSHSKRTIVNFLLWDLIQAVTPALPARFRETQNKYYEKVLGRRSVVARWIDCEAITTERLGMVISQKFVKQKFDTSARLVADEMVTNIRSAFDELLNGVEWMDYQTRRLAKQKADVMRHWIGYPDDLFSLRHINDLYQNVQVDKSEFFRNVLQHLKNKASRELRSLRQPFNKTSEKEIWKDPPVTINAFYNAQRNDIVVPAGFLQSPLYGKNQPKSLNYGSIGSFIGHEITHGFDNTGRRYNKNGDRVPWWSDSIIESYSEKAWCMVDQYNAYIEPEANMTVDGELTLNENIADNGGVKESYMAYRRWVKEQGKEEPKLPGLELTHNQLFFVSFAQSFCENTNMKTEELLIRNEEHSPSHFRVIGSLQNSKEFHEAFSCPRYSYMNPTKKCTVW